MSRAITDPQQVVAWRLSQFTRLAFSDENARVLAEEGVDWQEAERLLAQGCPHDLVMMLLLPLP